MPGLKAVIGSTSDENVTVAPVRIVLLSTPVYTDGENTRRANVSPQTKGLRIVCEFGNVDNTNSPTLDGVKWMKLVLVRAGPDTYDGGADGGRRRGGGWRAGLAVVAAMRRRGRAVLVLLLGGS